MAIIVGPCHDSLTGHCKCLLWTQSNILGMWGRKPCKNPCWTSFQKKTVTLRTFISAISWDVAASCQCSGHAKTNAMHGWGSGVVDTILEFPGLQTVLHFWISIWYNLRNKYASKHIFFTNKFSVYIHFTTKNLTWEHQWITDHRNMIEILTSLTGTGSPVQLKQLLKHTF